MKKLIFGILLSAISLCSFAEGRVCELSKWCDLPRASDYADIRLNAKEGSTYACTLSVDGEYNSLKLVVVKISGLQGFTTDALEVSASQGASDQVILNGSFTNTQSDPIIRVRRFPSDGPTATNKPSYIMCELGTVFLKK